MIKEAYVKICAIVRRSTESEGNTVVIMQHYSITVISFQVEASLMKMLKICPI